TTNKLVDVPIVVPIPPINVANPIGSNTPDVEVLLRAAVPTNIGSINTTMGVLFIKALNTAPIPKVNKSATAGFHFHSFASRLVTGSKAPVLTSPSPAIINAQTATNAS